MDSDGNPHPLLYYSRRASRSPGSLNPAPLPRKSATCHHLTERSRETKSFARSPKRIINSSVCRTPSDSLVCAPILGTRSIRFAELPRIARDAPGRASFLGIGSPRSLELSQIKYSRNNAEKKEKAHNGLKFFKISLKSFSYKHSRRRYKNLVFGYYGMGPASEVSAACTGEA